MYKRMVFRSKTLRPFATPAQRIFWSSRSSAKPNNLLVVQQSSQNLIARRSSSNQARSDAEVDRRLDMIKSEMTCAEFHDSVWGFVIYRCVEGNDTAWNHMLQKIQTHVSDYLEHYPRKDLKSLVPFHDLHVIDEKFLYGASIHDIRAHFKAWVPKNLEARLRPNSTYMVPNMSSTGVDSAPRYNFCLAVDESSLISMSPSGIKSPLIKLISLEWNIMEMYQTTHPLFQEASAEYDEEDGGWMNMPLNEYVETYGYLHRWKLED